MITLSYTNCLQSVLGKNGLPQKIIAQSAKRLAEANRALKKQSESGQLGFFDLPDQIQDAKKIQENANQWRGKFENFVVVGIGGSALGNIALQSALRHPNWNLLSKSQRKGYLRLFVIDNVDPTLIQGLLDTLDFKKTLFNVISKSGTTAECLANYFLIRKALEKKVGISQAKKHFVFTTDPQKGYLREVSGREGIPTYDIPPNVGGRFSVLSPVGLVSAAATGIDIRKILTGSRAMKIKCRTDRPINNPAFLFAWIHYLYYKKNRNIHVMMPYSNQLRDVSDWFRQLWAESLGKKRDRKGHAVYVGPTPVKALGVTDQHSQVQLYIEGPQDKLLTFLSVKAFDHDLTIPHYDRHYLSGQSLSKLFKSEEQATIAALAKEGRPSLTLTFPRIDPSNVGELIFMLEQAAAYAGELFNINAFDQPGVELGKLLTYALMGRTGYRNYLDDYKKWINP